MKTLIVCSFLVLCTLAVTIPDSEWHAAQRGKMRCVVDPADGSAFQSIEDAIANPLCATIMVLENCHVVQEWSNVRRLDLCSLGYKSSNDGGARNG